MRWEEKTIKPGKVLTPYPALCLKIVWKEGTVLL